MIKRLILYRHWRRGESSAEQGVRHPLLGRCGVGDGAVANAKPEFVLEALRMETVGVVSPFVLVLNQNALRINSWLGFAGGFGGDVVDGAEGGLGIFHFGDSERQSEKQQCEEQEEAKGVLLHSAYLRKKSYSAESAELPRRSDDNSDRDGANRN